MDKRAERKALITVLAIFSMGQIAGSIDAAIALIGQAYGLSSAMTMYVSSIAALARFTRPIPDQARTKTADSFFLLHLLSRAQ